MTEREWDKRLRIQTTGREDETGTRFSPYEPTPYPVLARLADSGWIGPENHLLDYGCGKGRVVFFLASQLGCRATGLDYSEKLIAIAEENRRRSGVRGVDFIRARAEQHAPREEDVFFFFNPFSEAVLAIALRRILDSGYARPRPLRLICYYPSDGYAACLLAESALTFAGEIDCRDLFDGDNPRERLLRFDARF